MAFQPKILVLTLVGILMFYNLIIISKNSYDKCKEETEELFKDKKFWIPLSVGVSLLLLSFMMTSKFGKAKAKAALVRARASGAARAII